MANRAEFFERLVPFHAPSTLLSIQLAYTLAKFSHRAQVRKELDEAGQPVRYFEHVKRVALTLMDEVGIYDADMVIGALLHDGFEDTRDITPELVEHVFGAEVTLIVKTLSKVPKEGYLKRFHLCRDIRPYIIKGCDRLDNLRSLKEAGPDFQRKQIQETRELYYPLFDRMITMAAISVEDPETVERVKALRNLIVNTTEGFQFSA